MRVIVLVGEEKSLYFDNKAPFHVCGVANPSFFREQQCKDRVPPHPIMYGGSLKTPHWADWGVNRSSISMSSSGLGEQQREYCSL